MSGNRMQEVDPLLKHPEYKRLNDFLWQKMQLGEISATERQDVILAMASIVYAADEQGDGCSTEVDAAIWRQGISAMKDKLKEINPDVWRDFKAGKTK